ncbi:MAG: hypothetical protein GF329_04810 [Candidatus Lokiarchaeota archaeon]|nr:hypothetical protein [Candidatus Lokiarchaeota archaeon]
MTEKSDNKNIVKLLKDLIYLNSVIATELIKITENTSRIARHEKPPESCLTEHAEIEKQVIKICENACPEKISILKKHVLEHE